MTDVTSERLMTYIQFFDDIVQYRIAQFAHVETYLTSVDEPPNIE